MIRVGVIGATGFIGSRIVEKFCLQRVFDVAPIVRNVSRLPVICRFPVQWRVAESLDRSALTAAMMGCDTVVVATSGPVGQIAREPDVIYKAAEKAQVRRLIILSTAVVHGQDPLGGPTEETPLKFNHELPYDNEKGRAELRYRKLRRRGDVEVVILRPCIVYGPRDRWVCRFAREMRDGTAYLVNGGNGICNTTYVDNLVDAIRLSVTAPVDGETFFIIDDGEITWRELYDKISDELFDGPRYSLLREPPLDYARVDLLERVRYSRAYRWIKPHLPPRLTSSTRAQAENLRRMLQARKEPPQSKWNFGPVERIVPWEVAALHRCSWKFPNEKAKRLLGFSPQVSIDEGIERTLAWVRQIDFEPECTSLEQYARRKWSVAEAHQRPALVM